MTRTTGGGFGFILGSWIGSGFCWEATLKGLTSCGSVLIDISILMEGSILTRGLLDANTASLLSGEVMLFEWLSLSGDFTLFSYN